MKRRSGFTGCVSVFRTRPGRPAGRKIEDDGGGDNRHRAGRRWESTSALSKKLHDAIGRRKTVRAAAGQQNRIYLTDKAVGCKQISFARAGSATSDVHDCGNKPIEEHYRAAGSGARIGPMPDCKCGFVPALCHTNTVKPGRASMIGPANSRSPAAPSSRSGR